MRANYGKPLRQWLKQQNIVEIIDFGDLPVFKQATTYPCILAIKKAAPGTQFVATNVRTLDFPDLTACVTENRHEVHQIGLDDNGWSLVNKRTQTLLDKLRNTGIPLGEYANGKIYYGIKTGLNKAFVIDAETRNVLIAKDPKSEELIKPFLLGRDIKRYMQPRSERYLILIPKGWTRIKSRNARNVWEWFRKNYSAIADHLEGFASAAQKRYDKGEYWWELRACSYYDEFEKHKILWPGISAEVASFALDGSGYFGNDNNQIIVSSDKYLLGVLNSKNMSFLLSHICDKVQGGFYRLKIAYMQQVPIRTINFDDPTDVARHNQIVSLVEQMLDLNKQLTEAKEPQTKTVLQRRIETTDRQIDRLVYELYELTEEEIKIVEGS